MGIRTTIFIFALLISGILLISLFLTSKEFRELIQPLATVYGQFRLANVPPTVDLIYINNTLCSYTSPLDCFVQGVRNISTNIIVKARITDNNGNCNTFTYPNNGTAYLCNGTVPSCTQSNADHIIPMNFAPGQQWGPGNIYCNMTGVAEAIWFYEINGTWRVNVTVTDGINRSSNTSSWTYGEIWSFMYPWPSEYQYIDMGTLTVGQWNNGTGSQLMKNTGNIILDLLWNATNFTGTTQIPPDTVNKTGTNYRIDDDTLSPSDTGNIQEANIPVNDMTRIYFDPDTGLLRCNSPVCGNVNASFNVYWHLELQPGLLPDTYQNTIEIGGVGHT